MWISEESANYIRKLLEPPECADRLSLEIILAHDDLAADAVVLHVIPDPFIRIQVGRIRRKEEYFQSSIRVVPRKLPDLLRLVNRMTVDDEENLTLDTKRPGANRPRQQQRNSVRSSDSFAAIRPPVPDPAA